MKKLILLLTLVVSSFTTVYSQQKLQCDNKKSTVSYAMNHPLHAWKAVNNEVKSVVLLNQQKNITQVAVIIKIASFDSKNANRDSHVIEATEALLYPTITFSSTSIKQLGNELSVKGNLTFHGVSKVIVFKAITKSKNSKLKVTGDFIVKMSEFKIDPPTLMGIAVDDEITINFSIVY